MKRSIVLLTLCSLITINAFAVEGGSDGTRGGGEVLWRDGKPQLRDLVDPSVCEYKSGEDLREENPKLNDILEALSRLDWYFAAGLKREINLLDICMTKRLVKIPSRDWDSVIAYEPRHKDQAAIRFLYSHEVYINKDIYNHVEFSDTQKAFLIIHEAIHSFISPYAERRNESVRSAVRTIQRVAEGKILSPKILHAELDRAFVNYPWTHNERDMRHQRKSIIFALSSTKEQVHELKNAWMVGHHFHLKYNDIKNLISPLHIQSLAKSAADLAAEVLEASGGDLALLSRYVNGFTEIKTFDPLMVAFSVSAAKTDPAFEELILKSDAMKHGPRFFIKMQNKKLDIKNMRIVGLDGYELLGVGIKAEENPVALSLRPFSIEERELMPTEISGFVQLLSAQANRGDRGLEIVRKLTVDNPQFYAAFGVSDLQEQLKYLQSPVEREKQWVQKLLPELVRGLRTVLHGSISEEAGAEIAEKIINEINWNQLGMGVSK